MTTFYHATDDSVQLPLWKKVCIACGIEKELSAFESGRNKCYQCRNAAQRERKAHPKVKPVPRPGFKFCFTCGDERPIEEFLPSRPGKCPKCRSDYGKKVRSTPKNRATQRRGSQKMRAKPERQVYMKNYLHDYNIKTDRNGKRRQRYEEDPEYAQQIQEHNQRMRKAHPEKKRELDMRRNARKKQATVDPVDYKYILERDGYFCYICCKDIDPTIKKGRAKLTFDHCVPLLPRPGEPQGAHSAENVHPAHSACNTRKKNIPFELLTPWQCRGV